jgi:hypothetical protein
MFSLLIAIVSHKIPMVLLIFLIVTLSIPMSESHHHHHHLPPTVLWRGVVLHEEWDPASQGMHCNPMLHYNSNLFLIRRNLSRDVSF